VSGLVVIGGIVLALDDDAAGRSLPRSERLRLAASLRALADELERDRRRRLPADAYDVIVARLAAGESARALGREFGLTARGIAAIAERRGAGSRRDFAGRVVGRGACAACA
jgi:hypothetical protein